MDHRKLLSLLLLFVIFFMSPCLSVADTFDQKNIEKNKELQLTHEKNEQRVLFAISLDSGTSSFNTGAGLFGVGVGFYGRYAISEKIGLGANIRQQFNISGFGNLFTELNVKIVYAITGKLIRTTEKTEVGTDEVSETSTGDVGGLRAGILFAQYFYHSSQALIPLFGFGIFTGYDLPLGQSWLLQMQARYDSVSTVTRSATHLGFSVGIGFWL